MPAPPEDELPRASVLPAAMRSAVIVAAVLVTACGTPSVDVPPGNDQSTSDKPDEPLSAPSVADAPKTYPYPKLALRGTAGSSAVRVLVTGAGNPATASVQQVNGDFCVDVD